MLLNREVMTPPGDDLGDGLEVCRVDGVLAEVRRERGRQDGKWGEQNHDPFHWLSILGEEYGEACRAANEWWHRSPEHLAEYRAELVQVAAVAVAMVECLDRGTWAGGKGA